VSEPVVQLEPVGGSRRGGRARALGAAAGIVALFAVVVALGVSGTAGPRQSTGPTGTSRPPATTGASDRRSVAPSPPDLSFMLPGGLLVVDQTHRRSPGRQGRTVSVQIARLSGETYYAIVFRCSGPGAIGWEIGPDSSGATESDEVPCDGKTHGTGIVTSTGVELPMRLKYDIGADFRFVVALNPP
jgi:hypothetical protein